MGDLNKYKNKKSKGSKGWKRRHNLGRLRLLHFSGDDIFIFPTACSPRDVILLNLKLTIAPERLGVLHSFFTGENYIQTKKWRLKKVTYASGVPSP